MKNKELKEMSSDELIAEIKAASEAELYGNVDEPEDEKVQAQYDQQAKDDFAKFTRLVRRYKKVQTQMKELATLNKDNEELQDYIKLIDKLAEIESDMENAKKTYLYESAVNSPNTPMENKDVKVSLTMPYEKEDFDKAKFTQDYGPETEMYQKYITKKPVKGNVKYKILG